MNCLRLKPEVAASDVRLKPNLKKANSDSL